MDESTESEESSLDERDAEGDGNHEPVEGAEDGILLLWTSYRGQGEIG